MDKAGIREVAKAAGVSISTVSRAFAHPEVVSEKTRHKVLQAAGRVIRTKEDRGLVLLIDSRYTRAEYRCLMPPHWSHMRYVSAPKQAQELVQAFWSETNKEETAL